MPKLLPLPSDPFEDAPAAEGAGAVKLVARLPDGQVIGAWETLADGEHIPLCVACEGSGVSSRGAKCEPCGGSGRVKCQNY